MNDSKTPITENFNPLDYEAIHQNLCAVAKRIEGMASWHIAMAVDTEAGKALYKLADEVADEAKRAEVFFNEAWEFYKEVKHEER